MIIIVFAFKTMHAMTNVEPLDMRLMLRGAAKKGTSLCIQH